MRHKELRRPPVKEVIFEIRFNLDEDIEYQTIFLQLFTDLRDTYSILIKTDQAKSLPENLPLKGLIRDKFISVDGRELLSLGKDIVVIQSLNHKTFSEFKTKLAAVVNVLKTIKPPMRVERVG